MYKSESMKHAVTFLFFCLVTGHIFSQNNTSSNNSDFVIAFGSCNKHNVKNTLWDDVLNQQPNVWIWGGDNIYADTHNMRKLKRKYKKQLEISDYSNLVNHTKILGTWDDHDYGDNDAGVHFKAKKGSQQLFLDFMGVPKNDARRQQKGIYHSETFEIQNFSIKILVLDTRYFRSDLTVSEDETKRYQPNAYGVGTILDKAQWQWLENELNSSSADFNVIVSSIQFLSDQHGFECWANFPHEIDRMKALITSSKAKGVIILSGDRHISEFSKLQIPNMNYPLIDFTSSGLTHSYTGFNGEYNPYRIGDVVFDKSFGLLQFNFETKEVTMKMIGDNNEIQQVLKQSY